MAHTASNIDEQDPLIIILAVSRLALFETFDDPVENFGVIKPSLCAGSVNLHEVMEMPRVFWVGLEPVKETFACCCLVSPCKGCV